MSNVELIELKNLSAFYIVIRYHSKEKYYSLLDHKTDPLDRYAKLTNPLILYDLCMKREEFNEDKNRMLYMESQTTRVQLLPIEII